MSSLSRYRKTIVAVIGAAVTWLVAAFADEVVDTQEWVALAVAVATAAGVYATPNDAPEGEPADPAVSERGDFGILGIIIVVVVVALLIALIRNG